MEKFILGWGFYFRNRADLVKYMKPEDRDIHPGLFLDDIQNFIPEVEVAESADGEVFLCLFDQAHFSDFEEDLKDIDRPLPPGAHDFGDLPSWFESLPTVECRHFKAL